MRSGAYQRPIQHDDLNLRIRRPPEEYVSLLSQSEQEFRHYVESFEKNPMFEQMLREGVMHRVHLRGKIPRNKYKQFMDLQLVEFLKRYDIVSFEDWEGDFFAPNAMARVPELAQKYKVPEGSLLRQLRYLRSTDTSNLTEHSLLGSAQSNKAGTWFDSLDNIASPQQEESIDLSETIEVTRHFVERYEVNEQDFLNLVLGDATPESLQQRFGCSRLEAEELLEATDRVYVAQNYGLQDYSARKNDTKKSLLNTDDPIAFVAFQDGKLSIQFDHDSIYTQRYHIQNALEKDLRLSNDMRELLMRARFINQRLSALSRLITTLCQQQTEYLESGDMRKLKPLAQAELARRLGEHPSTVSRLIRGKIIKTPWGKTPLLFLCQSKTDVVARLIAEYPKFTDQQVVVRLREDYDCFIARRTVAYHRAKRVRRNKRQQPAEKKKSAAKANGSPP